jgi:superoxide dismutase, Fe-Mn family
MTGPFKLSPLPYAEDALAPTISANTIRYHYNKHHAAYVKILNESVQGTRYASMKLEEVVRATAGNHDDKEKKIFNNTGQVWNHDFYWRSLSPKPGTPTGRLKAAIEEFGGAG